MVAAASSPPGLLGRIVRFLVVGGGSAVVQLGTLWLFSRVLPEKVSFSISWACSTTTHYLANRFWALPSARTDAGRQLGEYAFTVALSYLINLGVFALLRDGVGLGPYWATLLAIPPSTVVVFLLLNFRVFRART
jgi:putative flippase GtrA